MSDPSAETSSQAASTSPPESRSGVDLVTVLYIVGGIPAIVAFVVLLFTLVNLVPSIPA